MQFTYSKARHLSTRLHISISGVVKLVQRRQKYHKASDRLETITTYHQHEKEHIPQWMDKATLYVHWPYCEKRCTYCNFNKYISNSVDHDRMRNCLIREFSTLINISPIKEIKSVFFGGGTPSLAEPQTIEDLLQTIRQLGHLPDDAEVTLEANPTQLETVKLRDFKLAGINRVSMGMQALDDKDLKILGRQHTVEEAMECLLTCKQLYPGRTSVDLIFGLPSQTLEKWRKDLDQMLSLCDDHLSLYQLTLERGTALFKQVALKQLKVPGTEEMADMYELAVKVMESAGFERYEASNFARNGAHSKHNQAYWNGTQYIGIGPGAHGRFAVRCDRGGWVREARVQTLEPEPWMWEVEKYGHATRSTNPQSILDILQEILLVGLRTKQGVPQERWSKFTDGSTLLEIFSEDEDLQNLINMGHLQLDNRGIRATDKGINIADYLTSHILRILQEKWKNL